MRKHITPVVFLLVCALFLENPVYSQYSVDHTDSVTQLMAVYQYEDAIALTDCLLLKEPGNRDWLMLKAKSLSALCQYSQAAEVLWLAYKADSSNLTVIQELITVYSNLGEDGKAIIFSRKAVDRQPQNRFFIQQLAGLLFQEKRYEETILLLRPAMYTRDSVNTYVLKLLGSCYQELGQLDSAVLIFERIFTVNPSDPRNTQRLINLHLKMKAYEKGLALAKNYLAGDSFNTGVLRLQAYCEYLLRDYVAAESNFRKCVIQGEESKFVLKYLAMSLYMQEDYFESGRYFRKTFSLDSTEAEMAYYIGVCTYKTGDTEGAMEYFNLALSLERPSTDFLSSLFSEMAGACNQASMPDSALILLHKASSISPSKKNTLFRIAYQYDKYLADSQKAIAYYQAYIDANPEGGELPLSASNKMSFKQYALNRIAEITRSSKK